MFQNGAVLLENLELPSESTTAYCRLCLAQDDLVRLIPAHAKTTADSRINLDEDGEDGDDSSRPNGKSSSTVMLPAQQLIELIFECTDVRISLDTGDAHCAICKCCKRALLDFHRFRSQAKRIDQLIKLKQEETISTTNDETDKTEPSQQPNQLVADQLPQQSQPEAAAAVPRKRPLLHGCDVQRQSSGGGSFLAIGVKRPRPKITPAIIIAASSGGGAGSTGKHKCRYCPKSFKTALGLTEHARVHNRPHQCPNCLEQFQHAPSLARHIRNRTCFTFTKYRCRVCTESFLEKSDWAEHIKIHADDFPYQCQQCLSQFKHKATLRRHVNTVHLLQY